MAALLIIKLEDGDDQKDVLEQIPEGMQFLASWVCNGRVWSYTHKFVDGSDGRKLVIYDEFASGRDVDLAVEVSRVFPETSGISHRTVAYLSNVG